MTAPRGWLAFTTVVLVVGVLAGGLAFLLSDNSLLIRAVVVSAAVGSIVQLAGFGCAGYLLDRKLNLFAAWGGAMAVRGVSLVIYALIVIKSPRLGLALVAAPALITFALVLFVTSVVEPLFLNFQNTSQQAE